MSVRDLAGRTFGRLTVLERAGSKPGNKRALWRCRCRCGRECTVQGVYLRNGDTRSCGCLQGENAAAIGRGKKVDIAGQRFGRLVVLAEADSSASGDSRWRCRCDCGREHTARGYRLRGGMCLSCGCLRLELMRARNRVLGSTKRIKACRTCGRIYEATGPQKDCSRVCRLRWHAADEAGRRKGLAKIEAARELAELEEELNRRKNGQAN